MPSKKGEKSTGELVGRGFISLLIDSRLPDDSKTQKSNLTINELQSLKDTIASEQDMNTYNQYNGIYGALSESVLLGRGATQQFYHGFFRLLRVLENAITAVSYLHQLSIALPSSVADISSLTENLFSSLWLMDETTKEYHLKLIEPSLRELFALDAFLGIVGELYDIKNTKSLMPPIDEFINKSKMLNIKNNILFELLELSNNLSSNRDLIGEVSKYIGFINIGSLKPTKQDISETTKLLKDINVFRGCYVSSILQGLFPGAEGGA